MAIQGGVLSVQYYDPQNDSTYELEAVKFIKILKANQDTDDVINEKLAVALRPRVDALISLGMEEADAVAMVESQLNAEREAEGI